MAEEKAALEAKVFVLQPRTPAQPHTMPRPFSLSSPEAQVSPHSDGTFPWQAMTKTTQWLLPYQPLLLGVQGQLWRDMDDIRSSQIAVHLPGLSLGCVTSRRSVQGREQCTWRAQCGPTLRRRAPSGPMPTTRCSALKTCWHRTTPGCQTECQVDFTHRGWEGFAALLMRWRTLAVLKCV